MKIHQEIPVKVVEIKQEISDVKVFTLAPEDGAFLPLFSGGSHIITYIDTGDGVLSRSYSLTNHGSDQVYRIAVRQNDNSKGGSVYWHNRIKIGDSLRISYPRNYFPLSFKAGHHVFYAGGIGITPFLSMMEELTRRGAGFELHYTSKTRKSCPFYSYLKEKYPHQSSFYFSREKNRLTDASLLQHPIGTHVYFCGPQSFIEYFTQRAETYGYPPGSIHFERFTAPQLKEAHPFEVALDSGRIISVRKDQTLLDALLEEGIQTPYSCRTGRCGTCELNVIQGEVEHFDMFYNKEQKSSHRVILPCVSRAASEKLILELNT
ncbi:PDR/VanB family oxidoreductase [Mangrovibacillus sp. Mu-81]|jgi:dimethylamine monooxygenase subunit B|uniref:PDR/VanB family oxidoreductase n=1 Tax=Mangrovibacillus sp. Mu-81 TaxID=3121478 RepID=UPI002FE4F2D4